MPLFRNARIGIAVIGSTFFHYLSILCGTELPETQTSLAEREVLRRFLPGKKRIVEIGVFEDFTTRFLADGADSGARIYGVDPLFSGRFGVSWGYKIATMYNRQHLLSGRLALVRTLSTDVGHAVPAEVDYVFIDGNHSFEAIRADWDFWSGRLASDGIIALHDTVLAPGEPRAALGSHEFFESHIRNDVRFTLHLAGSVRRDCSRSYMISCVPGMRLSCRPGQVDFFGRGKIGNASVLLWTSERVSELRARDD